MIYCVKYVINIFMSMCVNICVVVVVWAWHDLIAPAPPGFHKVLGANLE